MSDQEKLEFTEKEADFIKWCVDLKIFDEGLDKLPEEKIVLFYRIINKNTKREDK